MINFLSRLLIALVIGTALVTLVIGTLAPHRPEGWSDEDIASNELVEYQGWLERFEASVASTESLRKADAAKLPLASWKAVRVQRGGLIYTVYDWTAPGLSDRWRGRVVRRETLPAAGEVLCKYPAKTPGQFVAVILNKQRPGWRVVQ